MVQAQSKSVREAMTILSSSLGRSAGILLSRFLSDSPESGAFKSMMRATRGSTGVMSSAPEVSRQTSYPASHRAVSRVRQDFCASGSPPVTQTWRVGYLATSASTSAMAVVVPPVKAYSVSHQVQRSGQPVSRINTVGSPERAASPCREKKISVRRTVRSRFTSVGFAMTTYFLICCLAAAAALESGYLATRSL